MKAQKNARRQILVANAEADLYTQIEQLLGGEGHEILRAHGIDDVIERLEFNKPDLVLLDLKFPIMVGMELLRIIHTTHPGVPVVTMTEESLFNLAVLSTKAGASTFVLKPLNPKHLRVLLHYESSWPK
jgi:DNA-binding NtrC family response regulator